MEVHPNKLILGGYDDGVSTGSCPEGPVGVNPVCAGEGIEGGGSGADPAGEKSGGGDARPEVVEVDAVPMDDEGEYAAGGGDAGLGRAYGPIVAGAIIDMLDLATFGVYGLYAGFVLGLLAGTWLCRYMGLRWQPSLGIGVLCGVYCTMPITTPIPVATLIGAFARYRGQGGAA